MSKAKFLTFMFIGGFMLHLTDVYGGKPVDTGISKNDVMAIGSSVERSIELFEKVIKCFAILVRKDAGSEHMKKVITWFYGEEKVNDVLIVRFEYIRRLLEKFEYIWKRMKIDGSYDTKNIINALKIIENKKNDITIKGERLNFYEQGTMNAAYMSLSSIVSKVQDRIKERKRKKNLTIMQQRYDKVARIINSYKKSIEG